MAGELPLGTNPQAAARMYVFAAFIGGALTPALIAGLSVMLKVGLFLPAEHGGGARGPWAPLVLLGAVLACVACGVVVWMRQPKGARIAWDDWGITEWDGDGARVAIEWSQILVTTSFTSVRSRRGGAPVAAAALAQGTLPPSERGGHTIGGQLTLTDAIGRRVDLTQGTQNLTLNDRLTTVDGLGALVALVESRPSGSAPLQPRSENLAALGLLLGSLGYIGSFLGLLAYSAKPSEAAAVLVLLGGTLLMVRSLAFLSRARRDGMRGAVTPVELSGGESGSVRLSDGRQVDVSKHPDAGIHLRRGTAWLSSTGALETAGMRQARVARVRSNLVSGLGRLVLGATVFACGVPFALALLNEHAGTTDERVEVVWRARERTSGAALDVAGRRFLVLKNASTVLHDLDTGSALTELPTRLNCALPAFALSPGSTHALLTCDDKTARLFALESPLREIAAIPGELTLQAVTLGKERFVVGDTSGLTFFGNVADGRITGIVQAAGADGARVLGQCEGTGQIAFISLMRNEWKAWLATGPLTKKLVGVEGRGEALAFSPDCAVLAVAEENEVVLIDTTDGRRLDALPIATTHSLTRGATALTFSADGSRLAIATEGTLRVFDFVTRRQLHDLKLEWKSSLVTATSDAPAAIAFEGNDAVYVLARHKGVLLRVSLR